MDTCCSAGGGSVSRLHLQYFSRRWTACVPTELAPNSTHRLLTSADICILTLWYCIISLLSATHVVAHTDVTVFALNSFTLFCDSVTWWWNWRADIVEAMPFQSERWWQNVASALTLLVAWEEGQACEKPAPLSSTSTQALTTETSVWMWRKKMRGTSRPRFTYETALHWAAVEGLGMHCNSSSHWRSRWSLTWVSSVLSCHYEGHLAGIVSVFITV